MSGIVGILNLDGAPVDRELLGRMTAFQSFRGPDRQTIWIEGPIGLGHTLARTTDESVRERQPCDLGGRLWITADARVDAREDLRAELRGRVTANLDEATDPELILHAYDAWGEECLQHLLGDFSFALWDRPRQRLVCAVDHLGVKPFYYVAVGGAFVFSNTLDCVRMHPRVTDELNEVAIGDFLLFGHYQDRDVTVYADVARLPPGHLLVVEKGGVRRSRYWSLPEVPELRLGRAEEYVERFEELLERAVADRLRATRVGVLMSGGLDSPLVAATAKRVLERRRSSFEMGAFTVVYDHLIPDDERRFAALVAESLAIPVRFLAGDDSALYERGNAWGWSPPEPVHDPRWGLYVGLMRTVGSAFPVVLTGWDGDTLLRGALRFHWRERVRERRWHDLARDLAWYLLSQRALPPVGVRTNLRNLARGAGTPQLPAWLVPDFVRRAGLSERWRRYFRPQSEHSARGGSRTAIDLPLWMVLFDTYDPGQTGCSLESRHPLMDLRVLAFALALPAVPWCVEKELFRRCLRGVPEEVRSRRKTPLRLNPVVARLRAVGTHELERMLPRPEVLQFVQEIPTVDPQAEVEAIWSNLQPASLNHWFRARIGRRDDERSGPSAPATGASGQEAL